MYLYFEHSDGSFTLIGKCESQNEIYQKINEYVRVLNPNYKIYYIREWGDLDNGGINYDVGSHTEFFHVYRGMLKDA